MKKIRILFVCMGNICRSPTAQGVFQQYLQNADMAADVEIDSAGTINFHRGKSPDSRAQHAAGQRGYDISSLRARQVNNNDFYHFDYLLAMDQHNLDDLLAACPSDASAQIQLFLDYGQRYHEREVPDPYYGGADGFEHVLNLIEDAAEGLITQMQRKIT